MSGDNPARACAEALLRDLGTSGPILMYTSYERGVIEGLAGMVSDTNIVDGLNALIERLVDLHPPTRDTLPLVYARLVVDQGGYSDGGAGVGLQSA